MCTKFYESQSEHHFLYSKYIIQSVTEIILKNQPRPREETFRHDPRNMIKMTPEHAKTDRQTERQTDRQTNKQTHKQTNSEMIHKWFPNSENNWKTMSAEPYKISKKHSELNRSLPRPSKNTKTNKITKKTKRRSHRNTAIVSKKRG